MSANYLDDRQEGCYLENQRTGRTWHPSETACGEL